MSSRMVVYTFFLHKKASRRPASWKIARRRLDLLSVKNDLPLRRGAGPANSLTGQQKSSDYLIAFAVAFFGDDDDGSVSVGWRHLCIPWPLVPPLDRLRRRVSLNVRRSHRGRPILFPQPPDVDKRDYRMRWLKRGVERKCRIVPHHSFMASFFLLFLLLYLKPFPRRWNRCRGGTELLTLRCSTSHPMPDKKIVWYRVIILSRLDTHKKEEKKGEKIR